MRLSIFKTNLKSGIKNFVIITFPTLLILFFFFEFIVFRFFIPVSDAFYYQMDSDFDILKFDNKDVPTKGQYSQGPLGKQLVNWEVNSEGWLSNIPYDKITPGKILAVIGDSFIEAKQINVGESYPHLLNDQYEDSIAVYGFGISGAPLSQYLQMSKYVQYHYDPDILIFNIFYNDFEESLFEYAKHKDSFWTMVEKDNDFLMKEPMEKVSVRIQGEKLNKNTIYWLKKSATFRYFEYQVNKNIRMLSKRKKNQKTKPKQEKERIRKQKIIKVTESILKKIKETLPQKKIIFVMDTDRNAIYKNDVINSRFTWLNRLMEELCEKYNFGFLDLTETMVENYRKQKKRFEFESDGHWNAHGHYVVAKAIDQYLKTHDE